MVCPQPSDHRCNVALGSFGEPMMEPDLKARAAVKLALPKSRSPKKVTAIEVVRSLPKELEAARRAGKTWAEIAENVADIGTFSADALRQAAASLKLAKARAASSQASGDGNATRKPRVRVPAIKTEAALCPAPSAFSDAFKIRTDDLSDLAGKS